MNRQEQQLGNLLKGVDVRDFKGNRELIISGLSADSRSVEKDDLFFALPGTHVDGHDFIPVALQRGAAAIVAERPGAWGDCYVLVQSSLEEMARISSNFYGHPAERLNLIAITGSNGKSTCAYLIESMLGSANRTTGLLSTIEYRCPGWSRPASLTTPLSIDLHRYLYQMRNAGASDVVMEVSSQAIMLKRVLGMHFSSALFINFTQDHLDFHKTMSAYGEAKKSLFHHYLRKDGTAVLNGDDPFIQTLVGELAHQKTLLFGQSPNLSIRASRIEIDSQRTRFVLETPKGSIEIESPLLGFHNAENLSASAAVGIAEQLPLEQIQQGLQSVKAIPGRLESVRCGQNFSVLVDYAHTPDALRRVLSLLRQIPHRRIITVFGCGGERDSLKRPLMGKTVCELSDVVYVTTDNPRKEDPWKIIQDIEGGMKGYESKYTIIPDRREAIVSAIQAARESDLVLLAGKGHEVTQIWADRTAAFDDRKVAELALKEL